MLDCQRRRWRPAALLKNLARALCIILAVRLNFNELAAVVYADLFDWPLTLTEAKFWAVASKKKDKRKYNFVYRRGLIEQRRQREKMAAQKMVLAYEVVADLAKIPTVQAIFLTGSVAVGNARKDSDVDLMIVTEPGTLWLTRLVLATVLKGRGVYGKTICPNIFLDTDHLEITEKNLYTAHEILQARCLFDRGGVNKKWLKKNSWTRNYLPYATKVLANAI